ncbi:hypothetical protein QFZ60_001578 [Arthrobacter sp. B2I5]|uniref:hypothetical protein n=1 Tax=Arthrobacter sp. B2I5 TaxID=3042266 RepID=UPI00278B3738|nr:hypothetical protein [Arthrobacter sp. B2I5]MDQ0825405.1 hypothetical protein [Arthrobacter sp. B2I5]
MSEVESLAQSKTGLRHLQLISALTDYEHLDGNRQVGVGALFTEAKERGLPRQSVTGDLHALQERGWLWFEAPPAGIQTVVLNQTGVDVAEEFKELRANPSRRARRLRDDVLNWLYEQDISGGHVSGISDFLESTSNDYLGGKYSQEELYRATKWLLEEEYITGHKASGGELIRPSVTTKGTRVVEAEQSVNKALDSAGIVRTEVNITGSQSVNVAIDSSNVTQSNSMTQGQIEVVERIIGSVRAMVNPLVIGVSEEVTTEAQVVANQVEEEIHSPAPDGGKVKALLLKLAELAATGTVQGGIDALSAMMQQGIAGM